MATEYKQATITSNGNTNVRAGRGTGFPVLTTVSEGDSVLIGYNGPQIASQAENGYTWNEIEKDGVKGYIAEGYYSYVLVEPEPDPEPDPETPVGDNCCDEVEELREELEELGETIEYLVTQGITVDAGKVQALSVGLSTLSDSLSDVMDILDSIRAVLDGHSDTL